MPRRASDAAWSSWRRSTAETVTAVIPLTQEDLAAIAGTSRATVNRVLRNEQREGAVALRRGLVTVLDADGLRRRCRFGRG